MKKTGELKCGDRVSLVGFGLTPRFYRRILLSLGVTQGVEILVQRVAPLGCPIQIEVRGVSLALRKNEACHLQWE
ncbi:MAG: FeoA domain-containing protein [Legionellaceae bacterium]|nr:FeoA domain-containing protein [Legionellaceae bacterium]